jgi:hypothetical protein
VLVFLQFDPSVITEMELPFRMLDLSLESAKGVNTLKNNHLCSGADTSKFWFEHILNRFRGKAHGSERLIVLHCLPATRHPG